MTAPTFLRGTHVVLTPLVRGDEELLAHRPGLGRGEDRIAMAARRDDGALVGLATLEAIDWRWREAVLAWVDHGATDDELADAAGLLLAYALDELALERLHLEAPLARVSGAGERVERPLPMGRAP